MMWEVWGRGIAGVSVDGGEYVSILVVIGDFEDVMTFYIINDAGLIINQGIVDLTSGNYQIIMQEFDNGKYSLVIKYFDNYYIGDFNL